MLKNEARANPLQGAFMILSTPYTSSKAVDYDDLAGEVDFLVRCGVQGLVWPQNASEQSKLSKDERMRGMDVIARSCQRQTSRVSTWRARTRHCGNARICAACRNPHTRRGDRDTAHQGQFSRRLSGILSRAVQDRQAARIHSDLGRRSGPCSFSRSHPRTWHASFPTSATSRKSTIP